MHTSDVLVRHRKGHGLVDANSHDDGPESEQGQVGYTAFDASSEYLPQQEVADLDLTRHPAETQTIAMLQPSSPSPNLYPSEPGISNPTGAAPQASPILPVDFEQGNVLFQHFGPSLINQGADSLLARDIQHDQPQVVQEPDSNYITVLHPLAVDQPAEAHSRRDKAAKPHSPTHPFEALQENPDDPAGISTLQWTGLYADSFAYGLVDNLSEISADLLPDPIFPHLLADLTQSWLSDSNFISPSGSLPAPVAGDGLVASQKSSASHIKPLQSQTDPMTPASTKTIPADCLTNVTKFWPSNHSRKGELMLRCWRDAAVHQAPNIFCAEDESNLAFAGRRRRGLWDFDTGCWLRLKQLLFPESSADNYTSQSSPDVTSRASQPMTESTTCDQRLRMPSIDVFDVVLDHFFWQTGMFCSYIHPPTFSATRCATPLLLAMCTLGFSSSGNRGARMFASHSLGVGISLGPSLVQAVLMPEADTLEDCSPTFAINN